MKNYKNIHTVSLFKLFDRSCCLRLPLCLSIYLGPVSLDMSGPLLCLACLPVCQVIVRTGAAFLTVEACQKALVLLRPTALTAERVQLAGAKEKTALGGEGGV